MKGKFETAAFFGDAYLYRPVYPRGCCVIEGGGEDMLRGAAQEMEKSGRLYLPALVALPVSDWDGDLTPWASDCLPGRAFAGGGGARAALLREHLPKFLAENGLPVVRSELGVCGYSLGGLAALHEYFETNLFSRAASVSGAVWYPGFAEYVANRAAQAEDRIYLSLGKQEAKRGNPLMTRGGAIGEEIARHLVRYCKTEFVWNNGNHFYEPESRTARAILWLFGEEEPCGT